MVQEGDFLEITQTYEYTETVTEDVTSESQVVTEQVRSVTTTNLVDTATYTDTNINIVGPQGNHYGMPGAEFTTGNENHSVSRRIYSRDLPQQNKQSVEYGVTVYSHGSNASVPACANATSDCRDDWGITVRLYQDSELVDTITHSYTGINWVGSRDYSWTENVSSIVFNNGTMEFFGVDRGFYSGYYGPGFSDPYVRLTHNIVEQVVQTLISSIEMNTVLSTQISVYDSIYNPQVEIVDLEIEAITDTEFEITVVAEAFEVDIVEVFEVEIEVESIEVETFAEIESFDSELSDYESDVEVVEAEVDNPAPEAEIEDIQETVPEVDESQEEVEVVENSEPVEETETQEQEPEAVVEKKPTSQYSVILDSIKVALMVKNEANRTFETYREKTVPDVSFYRVFSLDGGQVIDNPLGRWMTGASEYLWDNMVDSQWQK